MNKITYPLTENTVFINNWRATWHSINLDAPIPRGYWLLEINTPSGYIWPDCTVTCRHCGACLGCIRKWIMADTMTGVDIDERETLCSASPTGYHEANDT